MARSAYGHEAHSPSALAGNPTRQAFEILHWGFVAAPAIAGLDKFTNVLVSWDQYLAPAFARLIPVTAHNFMMIVGLVEIFAALVVAIRPKVGAWIVAGWLAGILVNLLAGGMYYDVALRDFGLMLGAIALGRLAVTQERDVTS